MMSSGTLNGTLKRIGVTREELTLLGILLSNPNISLSKAGDRMGISKRTVSRIIFLISFYYQVTSVTLHICIIILK